MSAANFIFRLPAAALAAALAAAFGAMLACQGARAAAPAAMTPAVEQIHVHEGRRAGPALSDPSNAKVDANGLLRNGIVADAGSYG